MTKYYSGFHVSTTHHLLYCDMMITMQTLSATQIMLSIFEEVLRGVQESSSHFHLKQRRREI